MMGMLIILVCIEIAFMILCALMCLKEMSDRIIEGEPLKVGLHFVAALSFIAIAFVLAYCTMKL